MGRFTSNYSEYLKSFGKKIPLKPLLVFTSLTFGVLIFYIFSIGLLSLLDNEMSRGKFAYLENSPGFESFVKAYALPAKKLYKFPLLRESLDLSETLWFRVTRTPRVTVQYSTRLEYVKEAEVPPELMKVFRSACPNGEILSIAKKMGGRKGNQLIFWDFEFKEAGKRRAALVDDSETKPFMFDRDEPEIK